jgi:hypothetical protein
MNEKSKKILKVVLILAIVFAVVAILVVKGKAGIV